MKKLLSVVYVTLVALIVWSGLSAAGSTVLGNPQSLGLTRTGTPTPPTSFQDTITVVSAADSIRTSNIDTRSWDWGIVRSTAAATSPVAVAKIEVWVDPGATAYVNGDSLNFVVEPSFDGGNSYCVNPYAKALAMGASLLGNCIVMTTQNAVGTYTGTGGAWGSGYIVVDPDGGPIASTTANFYPYLLRDFRLKIFGDAGAIGPIHVRVTPLRTL